MQTSAPLLPAGLLLLVVLSGCVFNPIARRIEEKSAVYARLGSDWQAKIRQGVIEVGFTADMVYMALGHPAKTTLRHTPDGPVGIWIYERPPPIDPLAPAATNAQPAATLYILFFQGRVMEIKLAARAAEA